MAKNNIIQGQSIKYIMVGVNRVAKLHDKSKLDGNC